MRRLLSNALLLALLTALVPTTVEAETYNATPSPTWIPQGAGGSGGGGQVWAMAVTPTRIYLGGDFSSLRNPATNAVFAASNLVAIDRATGNPTSAWKPSVVAASSGLDGNGYRINPAVSAIAVASNGTVYVGGNFSGIGGRAKSNVAAVSSAGAVINGWTANVNGPVRDLELSGSRVYLAGQFNSVSSTTRNGAAAVLASNGSLVTTWDAHLGATGRAQTLKVSGSTVYLGGDFTSINGSAQDNLASVSASTGADTGWRPNANMCPAQGGENCKVLDLDVEAGRVFTAIGGNGGGYAASWSNGISDDTFDWRHNTDGDVQAVDAYDGVVYFAGHFEARVTTYNPTANYTRNQFYAANPSTGALLTYVLPIVNPATPGARVIRADNSAIRIGGTTNLRGGKYSNFLTFAQPNAYVPGPGSTKVTVKLKGCKTCKVRLTQKRGSAALWDSKWKKASKGTAVFTVPTAKTIGLTAMVDAPWEKKFKKTAEVVMRYKGKALGAKVSPAAAAKAKKASSCYAGTTAASLTFKVSVKKVKAGAKVSTRAWTQKTQRYRKPTRKAPMGVLSVKKPTTCR